MTPGEPWIRWDWVLSHLGGCALRLHEHIVLTPIAVAMGFILAFVLSLLLLRLPRAYAPVLWVTGILYTIPSLALFAFLVPITGLSVTTAEIGLVSYTLLILVRNLVAGLEAVPPEIREAARGMGMTPLRQLARIDLPLAIPAIVAGIRLATVTTIG